MPHQEHGSRKSPLANPRVSSRDPQVVAAELRKLATRIESGDLRALSRAVRILRSSTVRPQPRKFLGPDLFKIITEGGHLALEREIAPLSLEDLRAVVSSYGLDSHGRVRKWKDVSKVREFVIARLLSHAGSGQRFLEG